MHLRGSFSSTWHSMNSCKNRKTASWIQTKLAAHQVAIHSPLLPLWTVRWSHTNPMKHNAFHYKAKRNKPCWIIIDLPSWFLPRNAMQVWPIPSWGVCVSVCSETLKDLRLFKDFSRWCVSKRMVSDLVGLTAKPFLQNQKPKGG